MDIKELFLSFNKEDFYSKINLHIHSNFSDGKEDFDALVEKADKANAVEACKLAFKKIDQAVAKGILHKNTAARKKAAVIRKCRAK